MLVIVGPGWVSEAAPCGRWFRHRTTVVHIFGCYPKVALMKLIAAGEHPPLTTGPSPGKHKPQHRHTNSIKEKTTHQLDSTVNEIPGGGVGMLVISVPNHPGGRRGNVGGLSRSSEGTGRLSIVRPGRPKGRKAGPIVWDMLAQGRGGGQWGTAGEGRGWLGTAEDSWGRPGTVGEDR